MPGIKVSNEYVQTLGYDLYGKVPKAVLAAVAVSLLSCGGDNPEGVPEAFIAEWQALYENGIVPQKPPR